MRAMFQFVLGEGEDVDEWLDRLEEAGVAVDRAFGAIPVSRAARKYVARGEADAEAVERLRQAGDFEVFGDRRVEPTEKKG